MAYSPLGPSAKLTAQAYNDLHGWSIQNPQAFWSAVVQFTGVQMHPAWSGDQNQVLSQIETAHLSEKNKWFQGFKINYAENVLNKGLSTPDQTALYWLSEGPLHPGEKVESMSFLELRRQVQLCASALRKRGVQPKDRIAGYLPNRPEAIVAFLATASLGAIWTSASPDFGVQGVLDRFGQVEPKVLFVCDRYWYGGKEISMSEKNLGVIRGLAPGLQSVIEISTSKQKAEAGAQSWSEFLGTGEPLQIEFYKADFSHPLMILFSSGTTGLPKCIVHGHGGTVLQHFKEHQLQSDIKSGDCVFYFSTLGWMMWNWLVSALGSGASVMLYDGSPLLGDGKTLLRFAKNCGCTHFGTSAKFLESAQKMNVKWFPEKDGDLSLLRVLFSTGSPLSEEGFRYVYENIKSDLQLASISGGTDIVSCFVLGNPWSPVFAGQIQGAGLGMDVQVFGEQGVPITDLEKGELVCLSPFPCMPVGFWKDPMDQKYQQAYFEKFSWQGKPVWCHGDFIHRTRQGGFVILGRSDAVLNPGGVRIGTAEIYRQVEKVDEVLESIVVGQNWQNDVRVVLFVRLKEGATLSETLVQKIKTTVRSGATPRHVPAVIISVPEIPRTKSGKLLELAVRNIIHGELVKNQEAMANPESLQYFKDLPALKS